MIVNADKTTPDGIVEYVQEETNTRYLNCLQENEYGGNSDPITGKASETRNTSRHRGNREQGSFSS